MTNEYVSIKCLGFPGFYAKPIVFVPLVSCYCIHYAMYLTKCLKISLTTIVGKLFNSKRRIVSTNFLRHFDSADWRQPETGKNLMWTFHGGFTDVI